MSRRKKPRTISNYVSVATKLAKFAPALSKYKNRKTLSRWEKGAITRKERLLKDAYNLVPVNKTVARKLKTKLFAPGVQAIQLNNTGTHVEIHVVSDDVFITSNGRTWVYWSLPSTSKRDMEDAAEEVFNEPDAVFPIEEIAELAERAFKDAEAKVVYLWGTKGRVGDGFASLKQFVMWLNQYYQRYQNTDEWVNGIAFALDNANKTYIPEQWEQPEERNRRRKERQKFRAKVRRSARKGVRK